MLRQQPDIRDLDDGLPLPGIDWKIEINKAEAAKYGAGVNTVGNAVQLVTNGVKITEYRPSDSRQGRSTSSCASRRTAAASTRSTTCASRRSAGHVPIGNFVQRVPAPRVGYINRVDGNRVMTVSANVAEGVQTAQACSRRSPGELAQGRSRARRATGSSRARTRSARRPARSC